jgi:hypothetical protein
VATDKTTANGEGRGLQTKALKEVKIAKALRERHEQNPDSCFTIAVVISFGWHRTGSLAKVSEAKP